MTATKVICGFWKIWKPFSLLLSLLFISCLDLQGNLILKQNNLMDIELEYTYSPVVEELQMAQEVQSLIPLPMNSLQWETWQQNLPQGSNGDFQMEEQWEGNQCSLAIQNLNGDNISDLFPLQVALDDNSLTLTLLPLEYLSGIEENVLLPPERIELNIRPVEILQSYSEGQYNPEENILALVFTYMDFVEGGREINLEW
ncbi:MAG: hypothetical protein PF447_02335 [Spirochaetaceae bacterium]|jgi:hypothetical protein|nr:hypothetical protein [Spirochaetaceae bacterium]